METQVIIIISALLALVAGFSVSWFVMKRTMKAKKLAAEERAKAVVKDAETDAEVIKKNKILEAKEKFLQLKAEHERHIVEKDRAITQAESRLRQKESQLAQQTQQSQRKQQEYEKLQENLKHQLAIMEDKKEEMGKMHQRQ